MLISSFITFFINGKKFILNKEDEPDETLSAFLRRNGITSSKIGCMEGACGSCAVCVGKWDSKTKKIKYYSINACLTPIYLLHYCSILTSEGIGTPNSMHPIQERLARGHGSQCGYCSPGFVMAMYALLRNNPKPTDYDIQQAIKGNICRCTGYRPIIEAFSSFGCGGCTGSKDGKCCKELSKEDEMETKLVKWDDFPKYDPTQEIIFPPELIKIISETSSEEIPIFKGNSLHVILPNSLEQFDEINKENLLFKNIKVVSSGISSLLCRNKEPISSKETWISLQSCKQTQVIEVDGSNLILGASLSITSVRDAFFELNDKKYKEIIWFLDQFSSNHVRNNVTWTGSLLSGFGDFPSLALALKMKLYFYDYIKNQTEIIHVDDIFFNNLKEILNDNNKTLIQGVINLNSFKNIKTSKLDLSISDVANIINVINNENEVKYILNGFLKYPTCFKVQHYDELLNIDVLKNSPMYQYLELLIAKLNIEKQVECNEFESIQLFKVPTNNNNQQYWSVRRPIAHQYADRHVTGEGLYTGDIQPHGMLHLAPVMSTVSHAEIISIDPSEALLISGVIDFVSYKDIPGSNTPGLSPISFCEDDTQVFADKKVLYVGHIVGAIVAETSLLARKAAKLVKIEYKKLDPILSVKDAINSNSFFAEALTLKSGENVDELFEKTEHVVEGTIKLDGQQHVYLEPQSAVVVPQESNEWTIYSATQAASIAQVGASLILGIPKNKVVVKVKRVGGAFGGKCQGQSGYALYPSLVAANKLKKPVSCVLTREEDFTITGGRHPANCYYKLSCDSEGNIVAGKFLIYVIGGYSLDHTLWVSQAILQSIDNCYKIPNLDVTVYPCKTNTPSNTAMRGFGQPQAYFFIEHAMDKLARKTGFLPEMFRERNFSKEGYKRACGEEIVYDNMELCWNKCKEFSQIDKIRKELTEFNKNSSIIKQGITMAPIRFGLMHAKMFEQTFVLAHIYLDGTVELSIGGIDMGQGLNIKVLQVAANELNIPIEKITIRDSTTDKTANAPVTGGSQGADVHGHATKKVCQKLLAGLRPLMEANPKMSWEEIIRLAYLQALPLSAGEHCNYPREKEEGTCYHTSGAACSIVEVNTKTGEHSIKKVQIVMDTGYSLNPAIDIGQIEGAFMQMYGHLTMESVATDMKTGRVIDDSLMKYKLPRARNVPEKFHVMLLNKPNYSTGAVYSSKSTGEPPLMLGASIYFAIKDALLSINPNISKDDDKCINVLQPPLLPITIVKAVKSLNKH